MLNNKHISLLLAGFLIISSQILRSQDENDDIILKAKLWTQSGDTNQCNINYINEYSFQFRLTEVDTSGSFIRHYSPKDLAGFSYKVSNTESEYTSMQNPEDMGRIFLRKVFSGKYTVFQYLEINPSTSNLSFSAAYYLWDDGWLLPALSKQFEVESLLYHFKNCPELEYRIKTGELGLKDIKYILSEYENCELTDEYDFLYE